MSEKTAKTAVVIGAGPAGLMAAEQLAQAGLAVTIFDRMTSPARKFLMAGRGGLNLTYSEDFARFIARYGAQAGRLKPFLDAFGPQQARDWCAGLGQETFVGSSGRVFPRALKASPLLRAWLRRLADLSVEFRLRHAFRGFAGGAALFETPGRAGKSRGRCLRAGARRRLMAAPRRRWRLDRAAQGGRIAVQSAAPRQLRPAGRLVAAAQGEVRGTAVEKHRPAFPRFLSPRRMCRHATRTGRRPGLRPVLRDPRRPGAGRRRGVRHRPPA